jgi:ribosome-binding protein aMBF1 (putative translation factor)
MKKKPKKTLVQAMVDDFTAVDPTKRRAMLQRAAIDVQAAQLIYDMRTAAGLSQRDLAKLVGTTASVICRLEQADSGHSLALLTRIATALGHRIELRCVPQKAA